MLASVVASSIRMRPAAGSAFNLGFGRGEAGQVDALERRRFDRLEADVQGHQFPAPGGPAGEIVVERNARQLAFQVQRVFLAVGRVVEHGVDVMEDAFAADARLLAIAFFELPDAPVGDVVDAVAGFVVAVEGQESGSLAPAPM